MDSTRNPWRGLTAMPLAFLFCEPHAWVDEVAQQASDLLAKSCFACHGPDATSREAGLRLDLRVSAIAEAERGERPNHS